MDVNETVLTFPHAFAAFGLFICECCVSDGRKRTNEKQCKRMTTRLTASNNGHLTNVYLAEREKKINSPDNPIYVVLFCFRRALQFLKQYRLRGARASLTAKFLVTSQ